MTWSVQSEFGILCPTCEGHTLRIYHTQHKDGLIQRYRLCYNCGCRFETQEKITRTLREQVNNKHANRIPKRSSRLR